MIIICIHKWVFDSLPFWFWASESPFSTFSWKMKGPLVVSFFESFHRNIFHKLPFFEIYRVRRFHLCQAFCLRNRYCNDSTMNVPRSVALIFFFVFWYHWMFFLIAFYFDFYSKLFCLYCTANKSTSCMQISHERYWKISCHWFWLILLSYPSSIQFSLLDFWSNISTLQLSLHSSPRFPNTCPNTPLYSFSLHLQLLLLPFSVLCSSLKDKKNITLDWNQVIRIQTN